MRVGALALALVACSSAPDRRATDAGGSRCAAVTVVDPAPSPPDAAVPAIDAAPPAELATFVRELPFSGAFAMGSGRWYDKRGSDGIVIDARELRLRLDYPLSRSTPKRTGRRRSRPIPARR